MVAGVLHGRRGRPLFFIDIAVPRNVEESVEALEDVYCYDIDDLKQVVDANLRERRREAQRAETLVEREVGKFLARLADADVIPTIVSLRERLESIRLGEVELVPMKTEGDRLLGRLADSGGKGLFVREIEEALAAGTIDLAVHSLKDLPAELPDGLELAAFPERNDPRDVLVSRTGGGLESLRPGALVGTASLRRRALVLAARPDVKVEPVRGNVDTRLRKLDSGDWDAS